MLHNLRKSFCNWIAKNEDFNQWLNQNLNISTSNFVPAGAATVMAGKVLNTPDGPVTIRQTTMFNVSVEDHGGKKVYTLTDMSKPAAGNPNKAEFPHTTSSLNAGRKYVLSQEEFEKLIQPPSNPQAMGGGMGGGMGGL